MAEVILELGSRGGLSDGRGRSFADHGPLLQEAFGDGETPSQETLAHTQLFFYIKKFQFGVPNSRGRMPSFSVFQTYIFLGFSIIILLSKMVHVMWGDRTPHDHILDADENLEAVVRESKCSTTSILSEL
jgi:hypothetical protein